MKLSQIMTRFPKTVASNEKLIKARDVMVWGGFRHLLVVDDSRLVGVLSERDINAHQARTGESLISNPGDTVAMAMNQPVHTAGPDDSVNEAAARMAAEKIGCLPVTEAGRPIGVVTTTDVLAAEVRSHTEPETEGGPTVREAMTADPVTVHSDDHLLDAAARMQQQRVRHLPVIDGQRRVIGMLSDRDIRMAIGDPARVLAEDTSIRDELLRVGDAMSESVVTISPETTCAAAARTFAQVGAGAVPVVDERERLLGIVSYIDLLRAFAA